MHVRVISQTTKSGRKRQYLQLVQSFRRPDGMPATKVIAHLGPNDPVLRANLTEAFAASRKSLLVRSVGSPKAEQNGSAGSIRVDENLVYLPFAVVSRFFEQLELDSAIDDLEMSSRRTRLSKVVQALVIHRCIDPGSKLAFQRWIAGTAVNEVLGLKAPALNNTRVHRALDELSLIDSNLQDRVASKVVAHGGRPHVLYLDLTDTWFDAGGGTMARRAKTKAGHRSKKKIHIALLVNERGFPMRWSLLPGALSETTVLPTWIDDLHERSWSRRAVLVFDRGMSCVSNLSKLVGSGNLADEDGGRLFLTSVKADLIPTCVNLDQDLLDALQALPDDAPATKIGAACSKLGLVHASKETFACDLGVSQPPANGRRKDRPLPPMRMYLYFNREIQLGKRDGRRRRMEAALRSIEELNQELRSAQKSRKHAPTQRKVNRILERHRLLEVFSVNLKPLSIPGRQTDIASFQVHLEPRDGMLRCASRYDGITLLLAHPRLEMSANEAVAAYRQKNIVEADFCTIKSVLKVRPTFHWTDQKIQGHITVCVLALLVDRLIESALEDSDHNSEDLPHSANALLQELAPVQLNRLRIGPTAYATRTAASPRVHLLLEALQATDLLSALPDHLKIPTATT